MLPVIPALAAIATALTTAFSIPLAIPQPPAPSVAAAIEFRQAEMEPGPGLTPVEKDGFTHYLLPDVIVSTSDIASAVQGVDPVWGQPTVSLVLTDTGRDRFAAFTKAHVGKTLAITVDGALVVAPVIREPIMGGTLQIAGVRSLAKAQDLIRKLGLPAASTTRSLAEALKARLPRSTRDSST